MGALAERDWSDFHGDTFELHTTVHCINTNWTTVIDSLAPLRVVRHTKGFDPWMNAGLISLRCKRVAALRKCRRSRKEKHCREFERLSEEFNSRSALARDAFMQTKILHALYNNRKGVLRELQNLGLLPKQKDELHGIEPDSLNSHFASVSTTNARVSEECSKVISQASEDGFLFSAGSANDVILAVAHFSTQARPSDGILQLVVARALPFLALYLAPIINAPLTSGIFQDPWRESLLVALKKTATPSAPTVFCPIALLCFLYKVLEKIVYDQIQKYLVAKEILKSRQAGYRQHNSTATALLRLMEDIRNDPSPFRLFKCI